MLQFSFSGWASRPSESLNDRLIDIVTIVSKRCILFAGTDHELPILH